ncbi:hypothetical protein JOF56_005426 [Kibdelosporangium banguiense]|uniref:PPE family protein n=1 Tax=Kibdelosporangium banguiense TaxID=1365924 RepID=A0ABS4TKY4_9PSEU|nr:hypothetical protein [Kibdelosporangium banguiense]MBP2325041.1 hypothetical protein [Kibdelosporangium banguiense]
MTLQEPNRPAIQEIENWGARSHRELYESVHINNDPGQAAALAGEWVSVGEHIGEASQEIARSLQSSESGWQGAAATKARGAMMQLSSWSESAAQTAAGVGARVADQARIAQKARDTMPEPVEFDLGAMLMRGFATGGLIGLAIAAADVKVASDRANAAHQQAVQVMATMENESRAVDNDVPVFAMPPNPVRGEQTGQPMMLRGGTTPDGGAEPAHLPQGQVVEPAIPQSGIPAGQPGSAIDPSAIDPRLGGSAVNPSDAPAFTSGGGPAGAPPFPGSTPGSPGAPGVPSIPGVPGAGGQPSGFASPADQFLASTAGGGSGDSTTRQNAAMPPLPNTFGPSGGAPNFTAPNFATPDFTTQRPGTTTAPQGTPPPFTMPGGMPPGTGLGPNQDPARRQQPPIPPIPPIPSTTGGGPFNPGNPGSFPPGSTPPGARPPTGMPTPPPPFAPPPSGVRGMPTGFPGGGGGPGGSGFTGGGGGGGGAGAPGFTGGGPGAAAAAAGQFAGRGGPGSLAGVGPVGGPVAPDERVLGPRGGGAPGQPGAPGAMGGMGGMGGGGRKEDDAERRSKYVDGEQVIEVPGADLPPSVIGGAKPKKQQG